MDFLEIVNKVRIEAGASGRTIETVQGTLPAEIQRLKNWTIDAWNDIQMMHPHWNFHYIESTHDCEVGLAILNQTEYAAGDVAEWMVNSFRIALPGETRRESQPLLYLNYYDWRDNAGLLVEESRKPDSFTVHPRTEAVHLSSTPDLAYLLWYDYRRTPQSLEANTDVPIIPARYHDLIVAWAVKKYGWHEAASEKLQSANEVINRLLPALELDQLDEVTLGTL